jgi:tRNA (mo5U34)-methyltransferase
MNDSIDSLSPWFYEFDLGVHGKTESKLPNDVRPIHSTRLQMINTIIDRYDLETLSCLDIACHEGFYSVELAKRGPRRVLGVDVREESLRKARFVTQVLELNNVTFLQMNAEDISADSLGTFEVTLFLGLLYHLENPMLCLRRAASVTTKVCILETQVIDDVKGETEWGAKIWRHPYQGVLALIDETTDFDAANPEMGATALATCPSRKGLITMLKHAGFPRIEFVEPHPGAYEQLARGKRIVCAAYKPDQIS